MKRSFDVKVLSPYIQVYETLYYLEEDLLKRREDSTEWKKRSNNILEILKDNLRSYNGQTSLHLFREVFTNKIVVAKSQNINSKI